MLGNDLTEHTDAAVAEEPALEPVLAVLLDGRQVAVYPLTKRCVTIGRSSENDISLDDAGVSRHHVKIITVKGESVIEDVGSRNGTFVNFKWTRARQLAVGDEIILSRYRLVYRRERPGSTGLDIASLLRRWRRGINVGVAGACAACGQKLPEHESSLGEEDRTLPYGV